MQNPRLSELQPIVFNLPLLSVVLRDYGDELFRFFRQQRVVSRLWVATHLGTGTPTHTDGGAAGIVFKPPSNNGFTTALLSFPYCFTVYFMQDPRLASFIWTGNNLSINILNFSILCKP